MKIKLSTVVVSVAILTLGASAKSNCKPDAHVVRDTKKLLLMNKELNDKLNNASIIIENFLKNKNETSGQETIKILKEYVHLREDFITGIKVVSEKINARNLDRYRPGLKIHAFFDVGKWEKDLNQTKDELFKLEQVAKLYRKFRDVYDMYEHAYELDSLSNTDGNLERLSNIIDVIREVEQKLKNYIEEVSQIRKFTESHNLTEVITNGWIEELLDKQRWISVLKNVTNNLVDLEQEYHKSKANEKV